MRIRKVFGPVLLALIAILGIYGAWHRHGVAGRRSPSPGQVAPTDGLKPPPGEDYSSSNKPTRRISSRAQPIADARTAAGDERPRLSEQFEADKTCFDSMTAIPAAKHILDYCRSPDRSSEPRSVAQCNRLQAMFPRDNPTI